MHMVIFPVKIQYLKLTYEENTEAHTSLLDKRDLSETSYPCTQDAYLVFLTMWDLQQWRNTFCSVLFYDKGGLDYNQSDCNSYTMRRFWEHSVWKSLHFSSFLQTCYFSIEASILSCNLFNNNFTDQADYASTYLFLFVLFFELKHQTENTYNICFVYWNTEDIILCHKDFMFRRPSSAET